MPGFVDDPRSHINLIRDNLSDRYGSGFPIVRELLQNADDAKATEVTIGWAPGFHDASHHLLRGPALFAWNDGSFTEEDENAIRRLALSAKPSQQPSIGKFGLGLKSVFHLCEAFFYLYGRPGANPAWNILNPWYGVQGAEIHQSWEPLSEQPDETILELLKARITGPDWFCLWAPLRRREHCLDEATIQQDFPGDEAGPLGFLRQASVPAQLAQLLPLLRHIRTIRVWRVNASPRGYEWLLDVEATLSGGRSRYGRDENPLTGVAPLVGGIDTAVTQTGGPVRREYGGLEALLSTAEFKTLREGEHWPRITTSSAGLGTRLDESDKAQPHAAAYFMRHPASGAGTLNVNWAVFLPVDEPQETTPCPGNWDYSLVLHGYFFVDAGRARIQDVTPEELTSPLALNRVTDEATARTAWNLLLGQEGVLPLILPALERFAAHAGVAASELKAVTAALEQSWLIRQLVRVVCRDQQWVYRVRVSGGDWRLLSANESVLSIPSPPESATNRPFEVFPRLAAIAEECSITYQDWPQLRAEGTQSSWRRDTLGRLLEVPVEKVFSQAAQLDYLVSFLECCPGEALTHDGTVTRLLGIGKEALSSFELSQLTANRSLVSRFLAVIPQERRLPLRRIGSSAAELLLRRICSLELTVLPIPDQLNPPTPAVAVVSVQLSEVDVVRMLHALAEPQESGDDDSLRQARSDLALQVVEAAGDVKERVLHRCADLPLFWVRAPGAQAGLTVSWKALQAYKQQKALFCLAPPPNPEGSASVLQKALTVGHIVLVNAAVREALFGSEGLLACTPASCAETLLVGPALQAPEARIDLVISLANALNATQDGQQLRLSRAIRYLLHGQPQRLLADDDLYISEDEGHSSLWGKLMGRALEVQGARWRLVAAPLARLIAPASRPALGLKVIGAEATVALLREVGPERIDCTDLTEEEHDLFLRDVQDEDMLKHLACHPDVEPIPHLHPITPTAYWRSDFRVHPLLSPLIILLTRSRNPDAAAKQLRLAPVWSHDAAIKVALAESEPVRLHEAILDALSRDRPANALTSALRSRPWIPTRRESAVTPANLLHINGMEDEIARVVAQFTGEFACLRDLPDGVMEQPGFQRLRDELLETPEGVLSALGVIIEQHELSDYLIGPLASEAVNLPDFLSAFQGAPQGVMDCWALVKGAVQHVSETACRQELLPKLFRPIAGDRLVAILDFLASKHDQATGANRLTILAVHRAYLQCFVRLPEFRSHLPGVRLLSGAGSWKGPEQLSLRAQGVDEHFVLNADQADVLRAGIEPDPSVDGATDLMGSRGQATGARAPESAAEALRTYFAQWRGRCPDELIGAFLSLLGDDPEVRTLAGGYLKNHSVQLTREQLGWIPPYPQFAESWSSRAVHEVMEHQRFTVQVQGTSDDEQVEVTNLLGMRIRVPLSPAFEHLFVELPRPSLMQKPVQEDRTSHLQIRWLDPATLPGARLGSLLRETSRQLLAEVYRQRQAKLDDLWAELAQSEQLDLGIAQDLILEGVFFYLNQLGLHAHPRLAAIVRDWESARRLVVEADRTGAGDRFRQDAERAKADARERLRRLLEDDVEVQEAFLSAVMKKVGAHYQYRPESVPFELFQNADDAVVELEELYRDDLPDGFHAECHMAWDGEVISFLHWGRPINHFGTDPLGRQRGFDRDLEKMLVLSASDKGIDGGHPVTGKFGLGFKSVFLLTDAPMVLSDRLQFSVVGGVFPQVLGTQELDTVGRQFSAAGVEIGRGTLFVLPIRQNESESARKATARFIRLAPLLVAFARRIRRCMLHLPNGTVHQVQWIGTPVLSSSTLETGSLLLEGLGSDSQTALIARAKGRNFLLTLGSQGFQALPSSVPTVWVTAPTSQCLNSGFAVNAGFELDVGRAQLARGSSDNEVVADQLGQQLGQALCELFSHSSRRWSELKTALRLNPALDQYEFWDSLWVVVTGHALQTTGEEEGDEATRLLWRMLWGSQEHGMSKLLGECDALPSGLAGVYRGLTRPQAARFIVEGYLDDAALFLLVSRWSAFQAAFPPGELISTQRWLPSVLGSRYRPRHIRLVDVIANEVNGGRDVDPGCAERLAAVITPELMDSLRHGGLARVSEHESLTELLREFRFKATDQRYHPAGELLVSVIRPASNQDEHLRVTFAPSGRVLSPDYSDNAVRLFELCRGELSAATREMADWAVTAASEEQRRAVLRYLVAGDLARQLGWALQPRVTGSWFENLRESPLLASLPHPEQANILAALGLWRAEWFVEPQGPPPPPADARSLLEQLYLWWRQEGDQYRTHYLARVYGEGGPPVLPTNLEALASDLGAREEWLAFLVLGATFTLGRTRPEQDRAFLDLWRERQWLRTFADRDVGFGGVG